MKKFIVLASAVALTAAVYGMSKAPEGGCCGSAACAEKKECALKAEAKKACCGSAACAEKKADCAEKKADCKSGSCPASK